MSEASGAHVALLTQDAEPADERWLERLLGGFELAADVGARLRPLPAPRRCPPAVRLELRALVRLARARRRRRAWSACDEHERVALPALALIGARGFFTDANACVARAAWERVPFREVAYAEDRVLAIDMLRAGYAKAYVPRRAVLHSHDYTPAEELRRCFDEWRGLREVYGWREPALAAHPAHAQLRGELGWARRELHRRRRLAARAPRDARGGRPSPCRAPRRSAARLARRSAAGRRAAQAVAGGTFASFEPLDLDTDTSDRWQTPTRSTTPPPRRT